MKILVLEIPALHLGYLGCYGNDWITTPTFDRLAAEGVVFDQHFVDQLDGPAPDLFDRLSARQLTLVQFDDLADAVPSFLEAFADQERCLAWVTTPSLAPPWSLDLDLLAVYCAEDEVPWTDPSAPLSEEDHPRLQNTYAAVVTYVDAQLERLLEALDLDRWLVCVTSSRGLSLGEHGVVGPGYDRLHEEIVHVPLIVRLPKRAEAGGRVSVLTQPIDLLPWLRGEKAPERSVVRVGGVIDGRAEWLLRTPAWALLASPDRESSLYAKPEDRWEVNDLRQQHLELVEEMERTLRAFV